MGSRRMLDVWSLRYSPLARPSRTRAAPAKKRSWSTHGGSSSSAVIWIGLPVFSDSTRTNSSARDSSASAIFSSAFCRSAGVVSPQDSKAASAARIARSTSSAFDAAAAAYTSPVAGLTRSYVAPSAASTDSPLMMLRNLRSAIEGSLLRRVGRWGEPTEATTKSIVIRRLCHGFLTDPSTTPTTSPVDDQSAHSTVTLFARLRGLSTSLPSVRETW